MNRDQARSYLAGLGMPEPHVTEILDTLSCPGEDWTAREAQLAMMVFNIGLEDGLAKARPAHPSTSIHTMPMNFEVLCKYYIHPHEHLLMLCLSGVLELAREVFVVNSCQQSC